MHTVYVASRSCQPVIHKRVHYLPWLYDTMDFQSPPVHQLYTSAHPLNIVVANYRQTAAVETSYKIIIM